MEKVVSGIRPTGNLHLGNYFGAVKSFVAMQSQYQSMFFIADWHSLTTHPKPENIQNSARTILAEYLACGIDPQKAPIYVQSDVKETLELYLYLNMNTYLGELERVTTFKEKAPILWKCRNCGYVYEGAEAPDKCPCCDHPKAYFERFADNY